ncbi:MAG: YigZ family protein [Saprospiraceae bacterium]|nr:YigZ family protein [Saprospiraceae bacterium]
MKDTYKTITSESVGEFKDRGSKFIAYAYPIYNEANWQECLESVRKLHPKARHHCYAWRLGLDGNSYRANDDGEPSGTAGRPILGQIDSFGLTNIIVIVVRYFGGTLLGTSGLINAYKLSTADALQKADIIERTVEEVYRLAFEYALMSNVMNAVKKLNLEMVQQDFGELASLDIAIRQSEVKTTLLQLKSMIGDILIEMVNEQTQIEGLEMAYLCTR